MNENILKDKLNRIPTREINAFIPVEDNNPDNSAFYFLTAVLIIIVTFALFKSEILQLVMAGIS
jgi:hypothetical protein